MCKFRYEYIEYKSNPRLFFTDTDNLVYEIIDVYEDFYKEKNLFGFSDYSLN